MEGRLQGSHLVRYILAFSFFDVRGNSQVAVNFAGSALVYLSQKDLTLGSQSEVKYNKYGSRFSPHICKSSSAQLNRVAQACKKLARPSTTTHDKMDSIARLPWLFPPYASCSRVPVTP